MAALEGLTDFERADLAVSLAALLCSDAGVELNAENLQKAVQASNNKVDSGMVSLFASTLEKSEGVDKFCYGPGAGGGGGAAAGPSDGAAAAKEEEKEEEEEEEIDMGGGMDMFGGEEGGGDDY